MSDKKAKRDPEAFIAELDRVREAAAELIRLKSSDNTITSEGVSTQDFFPFGDISYFSAVHMKITRLQSLATADNPNLNKMINSIYDAINFLTFWGADVHLRMKAMEDHKSSIESAKSLFKLGPNMPIIFPPPTTSTTPNYKQDPSAYRPRDIQDKP